MLGDVRATADDVHQTILNVASCLPQRWRYGLIYAVSEILFFVWRLQEKDQGLTICRKDIAALQGTIALFVNAKSVIVMNTISVPECAANQPMVARLSNLTRRNDPHMIAIVWNVDVA